MVIADVQVLLAFHTVQYNSPTSEAVMCNAEGPANKQDDICHDYW